MRVEILLHSLNLEDGSTLLLHRVGCETPSEEESSAAQEICTIVGGLPFSLTYIAGYVYSSQTTLPEVLGQLKGRDSHDIWSSNRAGRKDQGLDTLWNDALGELSEETRDFLFVMAMLHPDEIPEAMLDERDFRGPDRCVNFLFHYLLVEVYCE